MWWQLAGKICCGPMAAIVKSNINQPGSVPSAAEQGIEAAGIQAENKLVIDFDRIRHLDFAKYDIRLPAEWHLSLRPVFSIWQESRFILDIVPPKTANLPGAHGARPRVGRRDGNAAR